jgi:hypothetical protein
MDGSLLFVLFIGLLLFELFLRFTSRKKTHSSKEDHLQGYPYMAQQQLLSPAELSFFQVLREAVGSSTVICPKVRLGDLFMVNQASNGSYQGYRNKIDRKHIDFLLCDLVTMRPLVAIELDDSSHQRVDRQTRDAFVNGVFAAARLPLVHIPVKRSYDAAELKSKIAPFLITSLIPTPFPPVEKSASVRTALMNGSPICPKCGNGMILRTAKSGPNAGAKFWGCSTYPTCRGVLAYPLEVQR